MAQKKNFGIATLVIGALILVISLWGINFWLLDWPAEERGTFGDMFGVVNALFSGLAFAGIILTIYMQKFELEMQRNELEETREVFKTQTEMMLHQQNDTTFFSLLDNHRNLIDSLKQGFSQRYDIQSNTAALRDEVSGYAYIEKLLTQWKLAFNSYLLAKEDGLLIHPIHTRYSTIRDYINDSPKMHNLVLDIQHIYKFIEKQMKRKEGQFYKDTLWNNLSEGEKWMYELFSLYDSNIGTGDGMELLVYSKMNYPDFNAFSLPVVQLDGIDLEDEEILKISSSSTIESVKYFIYKDWGKSASIYQEKVLTPSEEQNTWYFDLNSVSLSPTREFGETFTPSVGIVVDLNFEQQAFRFFAEITFDIELEDEDWEVSQNGWKPLPHRLAKYLAKTI